MKIAITGKTLICAAVLCLSVLNADAGENPLSEPERALIGILRLAPTPLNSQWGASVSDFDDLRWGDLDAKTAQKREQLAAMDAAGDPEAYADLQYELAQLLQNLGKKEEAAQTARNAVARYGDLIRKGPGSARLLYKKGLVEGFMLPGSGKESFAAAVRSDPDFCPPYAEQITEKGGDGKWMDRAGSCFANAIGKEPAKAERYFQRFVFEHGRAVTASIDAMGGHAGKDTAEQGRSTDGKTSIQVFRRILTDENIGLLRKAAELDASNVLYRASLAWTLTMRMYIEWASRVEELQRAEDLSFSDAARRAATSLRDTRLGELREAEEHFRFVDAKRKDVYPVLYSLWSFSMMINGKVSGAEESLFKAISLDPEEGTYYTTVLFMSVMYDERPGRQDRMDRVAGLLERKCGRKCSVEERRIIARIRFSGNDLRETEKQLRAALAQEPASFPIRTSLAVALLKMNRFEEGMAELRAAAIYASKANDEELSHYYSLLAVLSLLDGDLETAKRQIADSLNLNPGDPVANALVNMLQGAPESLLSGGGRPRELRARSG